MASIARTLVAIFMIATMQSAFAETSKTIDFENQREEIFDLENWLKETRYKKETIDTTCYTREPYIENVCRSVTRYRQECETVPSEHVCRNVNEQVCRTENRTETECRTERGEQSCRVVVRYREECSNTGGGQQCRTIPGEVRCERAPNGENRCVKIPPREECSGSPSRRECRQVPYEERECSDGPSRQVCGPVTRPHQVCENRSREVCETIPAHRECSNVPYQAEECKDETLYRSVPYDCRKEVDVPYEVTLKTHQANVQVLFDAKGADLFSSYNVALDTKGEMSLTASEKAGAKILAYAKKDIKKETSGDVNTIKAVYNVTMFNLAELFNVSAKGITDVVLKKQSMSFVVNGKFDQSKSTLSVKIAKKDDVKFEKVLKASQFKATLEKGVTKVDIDLGALGAPKFGGLFSKTHQVTLKLKLNASDAGEVILPKLEKISTETSVEVKVD